jgi:hypothetical protein
MNYPLNNNLVEIENNIYTNFNTSCPHGNIKTTIDVCPSNVEFLQIKRNLKSRLSPILDNHYVDNIELSFHKFSRYDEFHSNHQWDLVGAIFSVGLIIPFLMPKMIHSLYKYSTTEDYNYIAYFIHLREKMLEKVDE